MTTLAQRMALLGTENAFRLGDDIARCVARGMEVIRLNLGEPDFDSAPHINEAAAASLRAGNSHYCDPAGLASLRTAIAKHIARTRGLEIDLDRIIVTPGAKPPIGYTMMTYVDSGDEVIYPSPGFPIYESWVNFCSATPVPLHLSEERGFTFTADDLAALITDKTKVIILNSPSNPTGGVLDTEELSSIAAVIRERCNPDVRIYSDEIYEHILFDGEQHASIANAEGMEERTILVSGHSKGFAMTGWRLGYAVLPTAEEAACFKNLNINLVSCVPPFIQEGGRAALESEESAEQVHAMVSAFQERRDRVVALLNEIEGVSCQLPKGAFYVFPNVAGLCEKLGICEAHAALPPASRSRTSPSEMLQMFLLYRHGVATMDRNSFGRVGAEGRHYLRLSIAAAIDVIEEGVARIARGGADARGFADFMREERLW